MSDQIHDKKHDQRAVSSDDTEKLKQYIDKTLHKSTRLQRLVGVLTTILLLIGVTFLVISLASQSAQNKALISHITMVKKRDTLLQTTIKKKDMQLRDTIKKVRKETYRLVAQHLTAFPQDTSISHNTTFTAITITCVDFATLNKINQSILKSSGVINSKITFTAGQSTITVVHTGTTDKLFASMEKASPDLITDDEVTDIEEGKIELKFK